MEKALAALHQACHPGDVIRFEFATQDGQVGLFISASDELASRAIEPIIASYPQCTLKDVPATPWAGDVRVCRAGLRLSPDLYPILRHAQFEDTLNRTVADPIAGILRAIRPQEGMESRIEIVVTPAGHPLRHRAERAVETLDREFLRHHHRLARFYARCCLRGGGLILAKVIGVIARCSPHVRREQLDTSGSRLHEREADLQAASEKIGSHLFEAEIVLCVAAGPEQAAAARDRLREMAGAFGAFSKSRLATFESVSIGRGSRQFLLSHEELATLFHPPVSTAAVDRMQVSDFTQLPAPAHSWGGREPGGVTLGRVLFRDDSREFGLALEDRRRHLCIVGKTGMGKTTLMQSMIASDMRQSLGLCVVDPHGDLAESLLGFVPSHRTNEVIYFDAAGDNHTVHFNPLACADPSRLDQVTSGVVSGFKKLHESSWGPRLEDTLRNAVFAAVEQQGNLVTVLKLLADRTFRQQFVPKIRDEIVRGYWEHEFARWPEAYRTETIASIQNKIRPFVINSHMRAIVSESNQSLDLRSIMDSGRILIVNLSKGRVGEDNATLLGAFLVTAIQQAAMTRADIPEVNRRDFFLYVDEFQNFTTGSFASVLSEARKFRLSLTVAHQYLAQLSDSVSDAVFGNVGSIISFQVGSGDAEALSKQFSKFPGQLKPEDFTSLPKYTAYARLLVDGLPANPFSMRTVPLDNTANDAHRVEVIRRLSHRGVPKGRLSNTATMPPPTGHAAIVTAAPVAA